MFGRAAVFLGLLHCFPLFSAAQSDLSLHLFPDSLFVDPFTADVTAHSTGVENILLTKNVKAKLGFSSVVADIQLRGVTIQAGIGASVRFELHPTGQAQIVSNEYAVDFVTLDISAGGGFVFRLVSGHTSHHLSDNWYERLGMTSTMRYSRDYLRLMVVHREYERWQWYAGADYAYILTIGTRRTTPWVFQSGGTYTFSEVMPGIYPYSAVDMKIRQETEFSATHTVQIGARFDIRQNEQVRIGYTFVTGADDRGQFFPHHRTTHTIGIFFDR